MSSYCVIVSGWQQYRNCRSFLILQLVTSDQASLAHCSRTSVAGQPARVSVCIYKLNSRDFRPIYGASAVRVLVLLFSFSNFSDHQSLKIENENNGMKT